VEADNERVSVILTPLTLLTFSLRVSGVRRVRVGVGQGILAVGWVRYLTGLHHLPEQHLYRAVSLVGGLWFRKQERQKPARAALEAAKVQHLQRRVFRIFTPLTE
jgi:hypothetical protein